MLENQNMSTIREGILIKRMPANQRVETSGGKREGKGREAVLLRKSAPKRHLGLQFLKKGRRVIYNITTWTS